MTSTRITAAIAALSATAVLAAGCGGDDKPADSATSGAAKTGGTFTGTFTSFPDYLDPAMSYTAEGWTTLWPAYTGLLTSSTLRAPTAPSSSRPGPGLPEISDDGLTYTLKLREGLKYSDGSPVKASDFEHTIKRVLNLESGGSAFYLSIDGAEKYVEGGKASADISGITADDATGEITIKLAQKDGQFSYYLAMNFAGLVKGDTPFEVLTNERPSASARTCSRTSSPTAARRSRATRTGPPCRRFRMARPTRSRSTW